MRGLERAVSNAQENSVKLRQGVERFAWRWAHHQFDRLIDVGRAESNNSQEVVLQPRRNAPHVVVIGAGPVGLLGAIHLQAAFPKLSILLVERDAYVRTHEVALDPSNVSHGPLRARLETLMREQTSSKRVSIDRLVQCLREYATHEMGMVVCRHQVTSAAHLRQLFPDTHTIVVAQGAHSNVRKELFEDVDTYPFQNIVQVQFHLEGCATKLGLVQVHCVAQLIEFPFEESVTILDNNNNNNNNNTTRVTLRFFVPDAMYATLPMANPAHPLPVEQLPASLAYAIQVCMRARKGMNVLDDSTPRITKFQLEAYACRTFARRWDTCNWLLLGDAAFAVPYFRALNAGAKCASQLPSWLAAFFARLQDNNAHANLTPGDVSHYRRCMFDRFSTELVAASAKDLVVESAKSLAFLSNMIPSLCGAQQQLARASFARPQIKLTPAPTRHVWTTRPHVTMLLLVFVLLLALVGLRMHA
jgi:2-polyprenyl-6-methoxyphenol hydroxylase-like FAD-dependent oxidoreductase